MWASDDLTCAITAPTGLAAFNVGGNTIHRAFQLPIEHEGKSATYWSSSQKVMRTTLRSVKFIIVDEVSMVSSLNLAYMHLRLEELIGTNEWFGSKNMLYVGDLLQLPPVNGNHVFEKITKKFFHGFSVGFCINEEEGYLLPTIARKITCRRFD